MKRPSPRLPSVAAKYSFALTCISTASRNNALKASPPAKKAVAGWGTLLQIRITHHGEMAEWFKAHAWKACVGKIYRGFESLSLRHLKTFGHYASDSCQTGCNRPGPLECCRRAPIATG